MSENYFTGLYSHDVSAHLEKKGKFTYLSWAYAVAELGKIDPTATWNVVRFNGFPYLESKCGYFVEVEVTVKGVMKSQIHPVLDNNNKPIAQPNSFQINTSIQRCLVKAIALHGLGLYIYYGEDLPESKEPTIEEKQEIAAREQEERSNLIKTWTKQINAQTSIDGLRALWPTFPRHIKEELTPIATAKSIELTPKQEAA